MPRRSLGAIALGTLAALGAPGSAGSHPHVFVEHSMVVVFGPTGVEALRVTWTFDEMTSDQLLVEFDGDRDGAFGPREAEALERDYLEPKRRHGYFIDLKVNGVPAELGPARGFQARVGHGRVSVTFTVPVRAPRASVGTAEVVVDDPSFFTAFVLRSQEPVTVEAPRRYRVECAVSGDANNLEPEVVRCTYR